MANAEKLREAVDILTPLGFTAMNPSAYYMYADLYDKTELKNVLHIRILGNSSRYSDNVTWFLDISTYDDADGWIKCEFKEVFDTLSDLLSYLMIFGG